MHRILITEDEAVIAVELGRTLVEMGYEVVGTAGSGQEAVEMARRLRPELILMDIVMPGNMDGIAAAEIIKEEMDISVVFLTAYAGEELVERAKQVRPLGYIVKPFQEDQVRAALEVAIYKNMMEKRLRQAQKMEAIGTLAGGIAHEFNNLLTGIQLGIELMLYDISPAHPRYKTLKNIEKRIERGANFTALLLGYARRGKYQLKSLNLNDLVNESSNAFEKLNKVFKIHRELASNLFNIMADPGQIAQALLNLFLNAVEAMPGGGELVIKSKNVTPHGKESDLYTIPPGNYVQLSVTDTGIGMEKETLERVFDPFFTTKEFADSAGLGLSCVYGIVKNHNGYIDVISEKGRGTTVDIYLPAT